MLYCCALVQTIALFIASSSHPLSAIQVQSSPDQVPAAPFFDPKLFHPPIPTKTPEAERPEEARQRGLEGRCALSFVVDVQGQPQDIHLIRCTDPIFATNSLHAIQSYRFKPATTIPNNTPVPVRLNIEINYLLGRPDGTEILPPARVRMGFVMPDGPVSPEPDGKGMFTLSPNFGAPEFFPRIKKVPDKSFASAAFDFDDGVGCTLALTITQSGKTSDVKAVKCDRTGLEKAAVESLSKAQFTPAVLNGKAVPVHALVRIVCDGFDLPHR